MNQNDGEYKSIDECIKEAIERLQNVYESVAEFFLGEDATVEDLENLLRYEPKKKAGDFNPTRLKIGEGKDHPILYARFCRKYHCHLEYH